MVVDTGTAGTQWRTRSLCGELAVGLPWQNLDGEGGKLIKERFLSAGIERQQNERRGIIGRCGYVWIRVVLLSESR